MYSIGDRVEINREGVIRYGDCKKNPVGVLGTVVSVDDAADGNWTYVEWDTGYSNEYEDGTLDIVDGK